MRKIYKLYIGIMLSAIAVACSDKLDSDNISKTAGLWRMFLLTRNLRKNGWRMPIPI